MGDVEVHGTGCHWCGLPGVHHAGPADHTLDGRRLFVEDALRRSREDGRKRYPGFHEGLRAERQFRWSYDSRGRMVL